MRTAILSIAAAGAALGLGAAGASAQPAPGHTSCADFGANVAFLATWLGPVFGETASMVASSGPQAFPAVVVGPEQTALCDPAPRTPRASGRAPAR